MRLTIRVLGLTLLSIDVEELADEGAEDLEDEEDTEDLPYGFSPPVAA